MKKANQQLAIITLIILLIVGYSFYTGILKFPGATTSTPGGCATAAPGCVALTSTWKISIFSALNGTEFSATNTRYEIRAASTGAVVDGEAYTAGGKTTTQPFSSGTSYIVRVCADISAITSCGTPFTASETVQDIATVVPFSTSAFCGTQPCLYTTFAITPMTSTKGTSIFGVQSVFGGGATITAGFASETESGGGTVANCGGTSGGTNCIYLPSSSISPVTVTLFNQNTASPAGDSGYPGSFGLVGSANGLASGSSIGMYFELRTPCGTGGSSNGCNATSIGNIVNWQGPAVGSLAKYSYGPFDIAAYGQLQDNSLTRRTISPPLFTGTTTVTFSFDTTGFVSKGLVHAVILVKVYFSASYFTSTGTNNAESVNSVVFGFGLKRSS